MSAKPGYSVDDPQTTMNFSIVGSFPANIAAKAPGNLASFQAALAAQIAQSIKIGNPTTTSKRRAAAPPKVSTLEKLAAKTFFGDGFNTNFGPKYVHTEKDSPSAFPDPITHTGTGDHVLELNLTNEILSFSQLFDNVPNGALRSQADTSPSSVSYMQVVTNVTNLDTGKGDLDASKRVQPYFEHGLWTSVPESQLNETDGVPLGTGVMLVLASTPHSATVNAQSMPLTENGPKIAISHVAPDIGPVDIVPQPINSAGRLTQFPSLDVKNTKAARLPQDLTKFIHAGTITQEMLDDPNAVLRKANQNKQINETTMFKVTTTAPAAIIGSNAYRTQLDSTFWISMVQYKIDVKPAKAGTFQRVKATAPNSNTPVPTYLFCTPKDITTTKTITVTGTQIQYSQKVSSNFGQLTSLTVSVATLVEDSPTIPVDSPVWDTI